MNRYLSTYSNTRSLLGIYVFLPLLAERAVTIIVEVDLWAQKQWTLVLRLLVLGLVLHTFPQTNGLSG